MKEEMADHPPNGDYVKKSTERMAEILIDPLVS